MGAVALGLIESQPLRRGHDRRHAPREPRVRGDGTGRSDRAGPERGADPGADQYNSAPPWWHALH